MRHQHKSNPRILRYFFLSARDECLAALNFIKYQWYLFVLLSGVIGGLLYWENPIPPKTIRIAVGQQNSTLEVTAKRYEKLLAKDGLRLEMIRTRGAIENLQLLKQGKVDVALSQGGTRLNSATDIVSLGSVGYQPLWFFTRKTRDTEEQDIFAYMHDKKISIGVVGSGTRIVVDELLNLIPASVRKDYRLLPMDAPGSIQAMREGKIDGMFLLAGLESINARTLLTSEDISPISFRLSEAMTRQLDYTEQIHVPAGVVSLSQPQFPKQDLHLIATTTTILVRQNLHPAIQYMFLRAASRLNLSTPGLLVRTEGFPAYIDKSTPLSKVAEHYFKNGPLMLEDKVPLWLASFFERAWFGLLTTFAIAYPILSFLPHYRTTMFNTMASQLYSDIFHLYLDAEVAMNTDRPARLVEKFEAIRDRILSLWVPKGSYEAYSFLLGTLELLRAKILTAMANQD
jgi:TRAP-type uncharacterized transport system substrate-binding protein